MHITEKSITILHYTASTSERWKNAYVDCVYSKRESSYSLIPPEANRKQNSNVTYKAIKLMELF